VAKTEFIVDGSNFTGLDEAVLEFSRALKFDPPWTGNFDAFNDMLNGGFGTPDKGFLLVWRNSELSRTHLGYEATLRWLNAHVQSCHPTNVPDFKRRIESAKRNEGETLFDMLVEIIRGHEDVELRLE